LTRSTNLSFRFHAASRRRLVRASLAFGMHRPHDRARCCGSGNRQTAQIAMVLIFKTAPRLQN
jgi:hypothetical protein